MKDTKYIHFHPRHLKGHNLFPFHIYLRHPKTKKYQLFLAGNDPLTKERRLLFAQYLKKGGILAIQRTQRITFIAYLNIERSSLSPLAQQALFEGEVDFKPEQLEGTDHSTAKVIKDMKHSIERGLSQDDFLPLILRTKEFVRQFSTRASSTISFAQFLAESFLDSDNTANRLVAINTFMALDSGIDEERDLADLVCASFLSVTGATLIHRDIVMTPLNNLRADYQTARESVHLHSSYIVTKSQSPLSERCQQLLSEDHSKLKADPISSEMLQIMTLNKAILLDAKGRIDGVSRPFIDSLARIIDNEKLTFHSHSITDKLVEKYKKFIIAYKITRAA